MEVIKFNDSEGVDLIEKMLVFNPSKRISIDDCLNHGYFNFYIFKLAF